MKSRLLLATIPMVMATTSEAATTIFTDQASFLAAITDPYLETFNGINESGLYAGPVLFNSAPYSYTATESLSGFYNAGSPFPGDVWLSTNTADSEITFSFTSGNIFGAGAFFFSSDSGGAAAAGSVSVSLNGGPAEIVNPSSTTSFLGFVSDSPISSLSVEAIQPGQGFLWPTVNDLIVGGADVSAIPESSSAIATAALIVGGLAVRRRGKFISVK